MKLWPKALEEKIAKEKKMAYKRVKHFFRDTSIPRIPATLGNVKVANLCRVCIDTFSKMLFCKKNTLVAADPLNDRVLLFMWSMEYKGSKSIRSCGTVWMNG